jgi:hypothetical protein
VSAANGKIIEKLFLATDHLTGIGVPRSTATAVTLFFGEPSITRSE